MIAFHFLPTIHQFQKKSQKQRLLLFRPRRVKMKKSLGISEIDNVEVQATNIEYRSVISKVVQLYMNDFYQLVQLPTISFCGGKLLGRLRIFLVNELDQSEQDAALDRIVELASEWDVSKTRDFKDWRRIGLSNIRQICSPKSYQGNFPAANLAVALKFEDDPQYCGFLLAVVAIDGFHHNSVDSERQCRSADELDWKRDEMLFHVSHAFVSESHRGLGI
jgi:hypothetical protein